MADFDSLESMLNDIIDKLDGIESSREISRICPACLGAGVLIETNNSPQDPNYVETEVTCPVCGGTTKIDWAVQEAV